MSENPKPFALPMFPLESALLPGEDLPLRIFEPRYSAMVSACLDSDNPRFGVVLISRGREVGGGDMRSDVGTIASIEECIEQGAGRYQLRCRTGARIRVCDWLPDDPYPRATVQPWADEPGDPVTQEQFVDVEDRIVALFERIADARGVRLPERDVLLGYDDPAVQTADAGDRLYALATRIPMGPSDRQSVLVAPTAAARLSALSEALESVAAMVEFELST